MRRINKKTDVGRLRDRLGVPVETMALVLKVSPSTIRSIECGRLQISRAVRQELNKLDPAKARCLHCGNLLIRGRRNKPSDGAAQSTQEAPEEKQ